MKTITLISPETQAKPLKPSFVSTIAKLDIKITNRNAAIKLMTQLEKIWKSETFAVLPTENDEWRLCNYNLLSPSDKALIDELRGHACYYA